jgi:hypothetical protein
MSPFDIKIPTGSPPEIPRQGDDDGSEKQHEANDHDEIPEWRLNTFNLFESNFTLITLMWDSDIHREYTCCQNRTWSS